ncbi:MAG: class I SAM-dependent methyltransferase [Chloroflexi bacterium]|nr:class I SAM-dependent methyltransferase [Chloroflexota bacterium]
MEMSSWMERMVVNHPLRPVFQRREVRYFRRNVSIAPGGRILEIGCGRGAGARLLRETFQPRTLVTFDLDWQEIGLARRYLRLRGVRDVHLLAADATRLPFADGQFDAVFETWVLHHVADWPAALREVRRVLRPGGVFCFLDISRRLLERPLFRYLFPHPTAGFSGEELREELGRAGLPLEGEPRPRPLFSDIAGVARRAA